MNGTVMKTSKLAKHSLGVKLVSTLNSVRGRPDEKNTDSYADGPDLRPVQHAFAASGSRQWGGRWIGSQVGIAAEAGLVSSQPVSLPSSLAFAPALLVVVRAS